MGTETPGQADDAAAVIPAGNTVFFSADAAETVSSGEASDSSSEKFRIEKYGSLLFWALRIGLLLLIIALIVWWMTRKVLPKTISIENNSTNFRILPNPRPLKGVHAKARYDRKSKVLRITSPASPKPGCASSVSFTLQACDPRYKRSRDRKVMVTNISAPTNVNMVEINGTSFVRYPAKSGKFVDSNAIGMLSPGESAPPVEYKMKNATITVSAADGKKKLSSMECSLKHK